jgi:putative restriction endonuclease
MADRFEMAHRTWPILVEAADLRQVMTYIQVAQRLDYKNARPMRQVLWPIQDYCMVHGLPPLTILVVNKSTRKPGGGFIGWQGSVEEGQRVVFEHPWTQYVTPTIDSLRQAFDAVNKHPK